MRFIIPILFLILLTLAVNAVEVKQKDICYTKEVITEVLNEKKFERLYVGEFVSITKTQDIFEMYFSVENNLIILLTLSRILDKVCILGITKSGFIDLKIFEKLIGKPLWF